MELVTKGLKEENKTKTYKEINRFLRDCEKHLEREYLKKTGWPIHIRLTMNPSTKVKIVKGLI